MDERRDMVPEHELEKKRVEFVEWQNSEHFSIEDLDFRIVENFIEECGMTMVPALLSAAVGAAIKNRVFRSDASMIRFVATRIEDAHKKQESADE